MTSRRDAVRALGGVAVLPFYGDLRLDEVFALGQRAHALAERRSADATFAEPRSLTPAEYDQVVQAAEHIIPRTSTPGATDAHVADFIDVMLADWYDPPDLQRFKGGLSDLDSRARAMAQSEFTHLSSEQQTTILESLDQEAQTQRRPRVAGDEHWFAMLKFLTIWGYYTSRAGIREELQVDVLPGYYDGNAPY